MFLAAGVRSASMAGAATPGAGTPGAATPGPAVAPVTGPASQGNPFIGTAKGGDTFPGADVPFGMVQWSPDTAVRPDGGGYAYRSKPPSDTA